MTKISPKALLLLVVCIVAFSQAQISQEYIKQSENFVRNAIQSGKLHFEELYKEGYNFKALTNSNVIQTQNTCSLLQKQGDIQSLLTDSRSIYFFFRLKEMIPKCNIEYSTAAIKEVLASENAAIKTPEQLFFVTALAYELKDEKVYSQSCGVYIQFLQSDGTSRLVLSQPENKNSIATGYILETVQLCLSNGTLQQADVLKNIDIPLESLLINSVQIEENQTCILESINTLEITAKIYKLLNSLPIQNLQSFRVFISQYKNNMLNFLKNNANSSILTPSEKFELVNIYQNVKDSDVLVVKKGTYDLKTKQISVLLRFENILGEITQTVKPLQATLYKRDKLIQGELLSTNSTNEQWPIEFKINTLSIAEPGFHYLKIATNETSLLVEKLLFTTSLKIQSIEFEVAQGKGKIPKKYTHLFNLKTKKTERLQANQNSFVYIQFSLQFTNEKFQFTPSQIAIHLKHPTLTGVTHPVEAEYDEISNQYLAIVDFGDPLTILPYSSTYEAQLIVADQRLSQSIVLNFATIETTFKTNRNDKNPPNDADYVLPRNIEYTINDEIKSPPTLFIYSIVLMMAFCLFFYFVMIKKIDLNLQRFTRLSSAQQLIVYIFAGALIAAFGLLIVFWVKINLMKTVIYICIGFIPFLIIGNLALNTLSSDQTNKNN